MRPVIPPARRSVWEVSVRDFSQDAASGVRPAWRGKFLAFTQAGTTLHREVSISLFYRLQMADYDTLIP